MGRITFYEGNGASQNIVETREDTAGQDFYPKINDEIRSAKLTDVRVGCVIRVYDAKDASTNDDWCTVTVKKTHSNGYIVGSFESSFEDEYVKVRYEKDNGLDGKISRIKIN